MPLELAFSSCPNDTFMFNAIVSGAVPVAWPLGVRIGDIEELNQWAFAGETDITKLSFFAYFQLADQYVMLNSGAALGRGCGPVIISRRPIPEDELKNMRVAVPGLNTTAFLLFKTYCPKCTKLVPMLFSEIEQAIITGDVDAGVIIHETRFTYQLRGLQKLVDLGEWWEGTTGHPIPLGCIAIKRDMAVDVGTEFERALKSSVEHAFSNRGDAYPFIRKHAKELDQDVIDAHIDLYVNDFSISLGDAGQKAVRHLYRAAYRAGLVKSLRNDIFL
ncbi:MAG: 1,4-dihydroxy-6-naphthoate synthase [Acidobacteria bacterium CG_4_9_14_3_um_filter_49_7]|nr:MAG: 1,4-dihydroxy-6-naphthoate synthase [Acidobacteria bacterium CG_4_9_14_3_um_filter_49_7]